MKYFFTIGGIQRNKMTLTNKGGERFPRSGSVHWNYHDFEIREKS